MRSVLLLVIATFVIAQPIQVVVPVDEWYTSRVSRSGTGIEAEAVIQWGVEDALRYDYNNQSTGVDIQFEFADSQGIPAKGVQNVIEWAERGLTLAIGYPLSQVTVSAGLAGTSYGMAQVAISTTSSVVSNKELYPYFSRLCPTSPYFTVAVVNTILRMIETQGEGWRRVAVISTSDQFGVSLAETFIQDVKGTPIEVATYQTFLPTSSKVDVEIREVVASDARVIVTFAVSGYRYIVREAKVQGILDDYHVFIGGPSVSGLATTYRFTNGSIDQEVVENMRGNLGIEAKVNREGDRYDRLYQRWITTEPKEGAFWSPTSRPTILNVISYDLGVMTVKTMVEAKNRGWLDHGVYPTAEQWTQIIRNITFDGASGAVQLNDIGDRPMPMTISNWRPEMMRWLPIGEYTAEDGAVFFPEREIIWHDNTTNYPDLLRGDPRYYWSCDDRKKGYDETGHRVKLHTPDSGDFDDIDSSYICDFFIDCPNLSDESGDCSANYTALFIVFGIITGLLILMSCCLLPFVVVFGFIIPRRRVRASSPTFLIIVILSCLLGYISEYSWYGRPHPVACGFRPWLLGLAVVSLISALSAKTFRLWRIFKKAYKKERITDVQLLVIYAIMVLPAVVILIVWTIVSTPTADAEKQHDEREHYVCTTGGFTGRPGGLIFFLILVGYEAFVLLIAAFLSIVTRNVPSFFNESKLIVISIYNLGFLAAVCIPVIIVLESINPFAAWIIRSLAVLYAFTATLPLQFASKIVGVFLIDRGRDTGLPQLGKTRALNHSGSSSDFPPSSSNMSNG